MAGGRKRRILLTGLLLAAVGLSGCGRPSGIETLGRPTPIGPGETPLDVLCAIQREFRALPKPVLREVEFRAATTRSMAVEFHRTREALPAYHDYRLTDAARAWMEGHTSAEIAAALLPLVLDPDVGGEAAVLLTGLATGRRFRVHVYGYHQATLSSKPSAYLHATGYRSIAEPGAWSEAAALGFRLPNEIVLAFDTPTSDGTLNRVLAKLQSDALYYRQDDIPHQAYGRDAFETVDELDEWEPVNGLPEPPRADAYRALLDTWGRDFLILASYPQGLPVTLAVYELGLGRYWPLLFGYEHTVREAYAAQTLPPFDAYRAAFDEAVRRRVYRHSSTVCGS